MQLNNDILVIFQINILVKEVAWGTTWTALQNKSFHFTGVLMWEVYSEGRLPYENYSNSEVVESLNSGLRLLKPRLAPDTVHIVMEWCWKEVSCLPRLLKSGFQLKVEKKGLQDCADMSFFLSILALTETRRAADLCPPAAWARHPGRCMQLETEDINKYVVINLFMDLWHKWPVHFLWICMKLDG